MSYKPPLKDEIPGITGFLYEANRLREPHEYTNYWKWIQKTEMKAKELGLSSIDPIDLVNHIEHLQADLNREEERFDIYEDKIAQIEHELNQQKKLVEQYKLDMESQTCELTGIKNERDRIRIAMINYGDHTAECAWMEWVVSGRMDRNVKEENTCDCGWYDVLKGRR